MPNPDQCSSNSDVFSLASTITGLDAKRKLPVVMIAAHNLLC